MTTEEAFKTRYELLNEQQQDAVNTIYGPVMVIAGPGTGKTEVLSMRIANLLQSEAQVQPEEILCLTYTDEATNSMRRRLVQIIGNAAHKVNIFTFHAFCNNIIQQNPDYFNLRSWQPISDLERIDILYELIEELPKGHVLRKLSGNIYYDASRLNRLFDFMKRENVAYADIEKSIAEYLKDLPNREEYVYKVNSKKYKKGDVKQDKIDDEQKRMEQTLAAAKLLEVYDAKMKSKGLYDFNDMIIWVLDAFKKHHGLLQSYQERFQFILVDEFQDTNGSQNELLKLLTEFWEDPNLFVVGDDDQSIYEFQGARIKNIVEFYERYKETIKIIVLPQNYRSSQAILDKATSIIQNNDNRLINQLQELNLNKNLIASAPRFSNPDETVIPVVKFYGNIMQEEADIVCQIEELQKNGVPLNHIAILYAQHKQADNIVAILERRGIPYNIKRPFNVLTAPLVEQLLSVIRYLDMERSQAFSGEHILFSIMHMPCFEIAPSDIALLALYKQENKIKQWRVLLDNEILIESMGLKSAEALRRLGRNLNSWLMQMGELPLPLLLEKILYEGGITAFLLRDKDKVWNMQVLHTFFQFVKELFDKKTALHPSELLTITDRMVSENIPLPLQKVVQNDNGVYFYTAHGSKGNEFEYVFLIGCTKNFWENKRGGGSEYRLPDTITNTAEDKDKTYKTEVARRLFYVALTRAKKYLHVSFAVEDNNGKALETSAFVDEICRQEERADASVPSDSIVYFMQQVMQPVPPTRIELANEKFIEKILQSFILSYTTLSKYLRCPLTFYYESILKVPFLKGDALAFGSAVHNTLERMYRVMKNNNDTFPSKEDVISYFRYYLSEEAASLTPLQYERRLEQGETILSDYYDKYVHEFATNVEVEYKVGRLILNGVPVTGKIDKIEFDGNTCTVIDYKTGDPDKSAKAYTSPPTEDNPAGGDYWRQMVFYKLLIESQENKQWLVNMGMFDFVEKSKKTNEYTRIYVPMYAKDEELVKQQIKETYSRIMNHEFDEGCGKSDCYWCNFAHKYSLVRQPAESFVEIDDI